MLNDYEVGYGKPPKKNRFKPGFSGNKKGRPKGQPNLHTIVGKVLKEKITIVKNGEVLKMTMLEGIIRKLFVEGLQGKEGAIKRILELCERLEHRQAEQAVQREVLQQDDKALLDAVLKEFLGEEARG